LGSKSHCRRYTSFHGAPEGHTSFDLHGNIFSHQLSIDLRLSDLLDINQNFLTHATFQGFFKLLDLGTFFSDDDTWTSGKNPQSNPPSGSFNFDFSNAGMMKFSLMNLRI
jgi:hypothetical protein